MWYNSVTKNWMSCKDDGHIFDEYSRHWATDDRYSRIFVIRFQK